MSTNLAEGFPPSPTVDRHIAFGSITYCRMKNRPHAIRYKATTFSTTRLTYTYAILLGFFWLSAINRDRRGPSFRLTTREPLLDVKQMCLGKSCGAVNDNRKQTMVEPDVRPPRTMPPKGIRLIILPV